jgi:HSP20 family molecular chaperone IbpA
MPRYEDFDNGFGDVWNEDFVKKFINEQRRVHRELLRQIKRLKDAVKNGKLNGRTEFRPFKKPGVSGFIFRGTFGTPEMSEENRLSESTEEAIENRGSFVLPGVTQAESRKPAVETFTDGNDFVAVVELPGVDEQEIRIETGATWVKVEALNFETTTIKVPSNADTSKISEKYRNGVLEIRMPLGISTKEDKDIKFRVV